jgi:hypothetical protein
VIEELGINKVEGRPQLRIRHILILVLGLIAALAVETQFAQENATKGEAVVRVDMRLIQLNVVAQDSKGQAAKDLTRDDFKLFDNGKKVPIEVFSTTSMETTPEAAALRVPLGKTRLACKPALEVFLDLRATL